MKARCSSCGLVLVGALLVPLPSPAADNQCQATIVGTLMREESKETKKVYTAKIDVSAKERCASVAFDLVVVEEANGKQTEVRVPKEVKIRDGVTTSLKLDYALAEGRTIVSHRLEQTSCQLCE